MRESSVLKDCLWCFAHHGFTVLMPGWRTPYQVSGSKGLVWRSNTGGLRDQTGRHFVRFGINGTPDILGFLNTGGRVIGYEAKAPGEKPTDLQRWFGSLMVQAGGLWGWGTSYDECNEFLKEAGL